MTARACSYLLVVLETAASPKAPGAIDRSGARCAPCGAAVLTSPGRDRSRQPLLVPPRSVVGDEFERRARLFGSVSNSPVPTARGTFGTAKTSLDTFLYIGPNRVWEFVGRILDLRDANVSIERLLCTLNRI